jgi:hypothetical protein
VGSPKRRSGERNVSGRERPIERLSKPNERRFRTRRAVRFTGNVVWLPLAWMRFHGPDRRDRFGKVEIGR